MCQGWGLFYKCQMFIVFKSCAINVFILFIFWFCMTSFEALFLKQNIEVPFSL